MSGSERTPLGAEEVAPYVMRAMIMILVFALVVMVDQFKFRGHHTSLFSRTVLYYVTRLLPGRF
jgi:hypothetical protein